MKRFLFAFAVAITLAGCSHNRVNFDASNSTIENEKGGVSAYVVWLKNKENSVDLLLHFRNGYQQDVLIKESSFVVEYNGKKMALKSGSGDLTLRSGIEAEKVAIFPFFDHQEKRSGEITLTIDPIVKEKDNSHLKPMKFVLPLNHK